MNADTSKYHISLWLSEFSDREMEQLFQQQMQPVITRQLRIALMVWGSLLLSFAIPDYIVLGPTRPFYYLLTYRTVIFVALLILFFMITPATNIFKISYPVAVIVVVGFSGFMLFFIYRPDAVNWTIMIIMLQLIGLLIFLPIRFIMSISTALYTVAITLLTRAAQGSSKANLIGLFVLLMLPVIVGAATAIRLGILQRRQYAQMAETEKINLELAGEIKQRRKAEEEREKLILELQQALVEVQTLSGLLPICASCKKIRDDKGYWNQIESYIVNHSKAEFSHGICPECAKALYPEFYEEK